MGNDLRWVWASAPMAMLKSLVEWSVPLSFKRRPDENVQVDRVVSTNIRLTKKLATLTVAFANSATPPPVKLSAKTKYRNAMFIIQRSKNVSEGR